MNFSLLHKQMQEHAELAYPKEACGVVVHDNDQLDYRVCDNLADQPTSCFRISPNVYNTRGQIVGVFHSHPDTPPVPSFTDMQTQVRAAVPFGLCTVSEKGAGDMYWWGRGASKGEYTGRPYVWGVNDCFSLVLDYCNEKLAWGQPDCPRTFGDDASIRKQLVDWLQDNTKQVTDLQECDIVVVPNNGAKVHIGVYVGNDRLLHHRGGRKPYDPSNLSVVDNLSELLEGQPAEYWRCNGTN